MKALRPWFLAIPLLISQFAKAQTQEDFTALSSVAIENSTSAGMNTIDEMRLGQLKKTWIKGFGALLNFAVKNLQDKGHHQLASQILNDWQYYSQTLSGDFTPWDLGDHRPVSEWLTWFYVQLESTLTKPFCEFFFLDDIKAFNYGYIVSFNPNGDPITKETWNRQEYQKHFVPFATASFYWASYVACSVAAPFPASLGCSIALRAPRYVVKRWVAPPVGVEVYAQAKKKKIKKV